MKRILFILVCLFFPKKNFYFFVNFSVESSQILQRNVAFEIPALKKQIGKCQQIREECHTRQAESDKNIHEIEKQYALICQLKYNLFIIYYFYFLFYL
jgi:hypothetical protein